MVKSTKLQILGIVGGLALALGTIFGASAASTSTSSITSTQTGPGGTTVESSTCTSPGTNSFSWNQFGNSGSIYQICG